jgi:hypothetical protein
LASANTAVSATQGGCPSEYWVCMDWDPTKCYCLEPYMPCICSDGRDFGEILVSECKANCKCSAGEELVEGKGCQPKCTGGQIRNVDKNCVTPCPDGKTAPDSQGNCPCGATSYNPKKSCCSADGKSHQGQVPDGKGGCGCQPGTGQVLDIAGNCVPEKPKEPGFLEKLSCGCYRSCMVWPWGAVSGGGLVTCTACVLLTIPAAQIACGVTCVGAVGGIVVMGNHLCTTECSGKCY